MTQSAVEWLYNLSKQRELDKFDLEQAKQIEIDQKIESFYNGAKDESKRIQIRIKLGDPDPFQYKNSQVVEWEQAKQMEVEQLIKAYNAGYQDAQCNHINDAENYVNEIRYLQSKIEMIDDAIKAKEEKIANMIINNVPDPEVKGYTIGPFGTPEKL